ncbi:MAG: argininosuccinate lyase [Deltaproteobacteria bacterium]|jgi:argininosuccinate lyase|nr:argininosuccinate lyase [Deltaproteobacteria bacterium]
MASEPKKSKTGKSVGRGAEKMDGRAVSTKGKPGEKKSSSARSPKAGLTEAKGEGILKGRLKSPQASSLAKASVSVGFDRKLARYDIKGSLAHAKMLFAQGLLTKADFDKVESGLKTILGRVEDGTMVWDEKLEDVHMNVEKSLTDLIGDAGARLHTARSRNDQVALDMRLYLIDKTRGFFEELGRFLRVLLDKAMEAGDRPMPGYTHLQRAQPILLSHHLMAYHDMIRRDRDRLRSLYPRLKSMPLGSGALAGTGLPIDPMITAQHLGAGPMFSLSTNSLDAVASRDHMMEFLSFGAILMVHLSRLAEDVILWCSAEFGFASLPDSLTTTSSMMPQKKNPDGAELMRGKAGRTIGNLVTLLTVVKGLPMSYNRDLQEDKEPVFDTVETLELVLPLAEDIVKGLRFNYANLEKAANDPYIAATDLADHLVRKGVPFRLAHEQVGTLVARAMEAGLPLRAVGAKMLKEICPLADEEILDKLSLKTIIAARDKTPGGTAWSEVKSRIDDSLLDLKYSKGLDDVTEAPQRLIDIVISSGD